MHDPDAFRALYRRHEDAVLRQVMARVRSPELAAELTAETFAQALATSFDRSRETEAAWLKRLAERELDAAYRTGVVRGQARARAGIGTITLDHRTLDRVWGLRGPGRDAAPKPRTSTAIRTLAADSAPSARVSDAIWTGTGRGAADPVPTARVAAGITGARARDVAAADGPILAAVDTALLAAARSRLRRSRTRRRGVITLRVALAVLSLGLIAGRVLLPDRPATATAQEPWLPFAQAGVEGAFPRSWALAYRPQSPAGERELVAFTTFSTGSATDPRCGALPIMGGADALVYVYARPDRDRLARAVGACAPLAEMIWREGALIVLGPAARRETRTTADEIIERLHRALPSA